jgi:hypothetical protein
MNADLLHPCTSVLVDGCVGIEIMHEYSKFFILQISPTKFGVLFKQSFGLANTEAVWYYQFSLQKCQVLPFGHLYAFYALHSAGSFLIAQQVQNTFQIGARLIKTYPKSYRTFPGNICIQRSGQCFLLTVPSPVARAGPGLGAGSHQPIIECGSARNPSH